MEYLKEFQSRVKKNDINETLRLWEEYCSGDNIDAEELILILKFIKRSELAEIFGKYVEKILPLWETLPAGILADTSLKFIIDLQNTNSHILAELSTLYLEQKYSQDSNFTHFINLVGLREKINFQMSISSFELLMHMKKGNFVFHTGGWGAGEILEVSDLREQLSLEFDYVAGKKELSFTNAFKTLVPLPVDNFLAMRFGNPDALEKKAKEDPIGTIKILLRDLGPKTASEIKDEMYDLVIPEAEWSKWWQTARNKMKKEPLINIPKSASETFSLRKTALSTEERLSDILESKPEVDTLIEMLYEFFKNFTESLTQEQLVHALTRKLSEILDSEKIFPYQKIQILFFVSDLGVKIESNDIEELLENREKIEKIVSQVSLLPMKKRILTEVKRIKQDWKIFFAEILYNMEQSTVKDYILDELLSSGATNLVEDVIEDLLVNPMSNPETFVWYFQKVEAHKGLPFSSAEEKNRLFEAFLVLLCRLEKQTNSRGLAKKMHSLISAQRFAIVRDIFSNSSLEQVKEFLLLSTKCQSISAHEMEILRSLAKVAYPELKHVVQQIAEPFEEDIIWATEEGVKRIKERINKITGSETIENTKEIELARAHGDLRENSEFKFALEKREQLQRELKLLSEQIMKARVLTRETIPDNNVGIGSVIDCLSDQGRNITYTILGPWEADTNKNIISFQSKMAKSMFGKKIGESFSFQGENFTITNIGKTELIT